MLNIEEEHVKEIKEVDFWDQICQQKLVKVLRWKDIGADVKARAEVGAAGMKKAYGDVHHGYKSKTQKCTWCCVQTLFLWTTIFSSTYSASYGFNC